MEIFDKKYAGVLLITPSGSVIMQQRDSKAGITNSGKITTFGGSIEANENPGDAALRELKEELSLGLSLKDISLLKVFNKTKEVHGEDVTCYIYTAKDVNPIGLEVNEGRGYIEISRNDDLGKFNLSVLAAEILKEYFGYNS